MMYYRGAAGPAEIRKIKEQEEDNGPHSKAESIPISPAHRQYCYLRPWRWYQALTPDSIGAESDETFFGQSWKKLCGCGCVQN